MQNGDDASDQRAEQAERWARAPWRDEPQESTVDPSERKDVDESPRIERETEVLQASQDSPAFDDPQIDRADVHLLPGTGDDDDTGDVEVDPADIHIPLHPDRDAVGPLEHD